MIIGIDFDNTLVNYDNLFYTEAVTRQLLPPETKPSKQEVRDALRRLGREEDFTLIQGHVYGPGILGAQPYPGAWETVNAFIKAGHEVYVVSHKTRFPYRGPKYDLHDAAYRWLDAWKFTAPAMLSHDKIFLEPTLLGKLQRITELGCAYFIDDLPELLCHPEFPLNTKRILFDPQKKIATSELPLRVDTSPTWELIRDYVLNNSEPNGNADPDNTQAAHFKPAK